MRRDLLNSSLFRISLSILILIAIFLPFFFRTDFDSVPQRENLPEQSLDEFYGRMPIRFERNDGQTNEQVDFLARSKNHIVCLSSTGVMLTLWDSVIRDRAAEGKLERETPQSARLLQMRLVGANPQAEGVGLDELVTKSNYLIGKNPEKWRPDIPNYARVKYQEVYTGVDLVYYGNQGKLEYDFIIASGSDPEIISLQFDEFEELKLDDSGNLVLSTEPSEVIMQAPLAYQDKFGAREIISANYEFRTGSQVGFEVGDYDPTIPLVIDPKFVFSTYLGANIGGFDETGLDIVIDTLNNIYITGEAYSFPATDSVVQKYNAGQMDVFIAKINSEGTDFVYATYLGGDMDDRGRGIDVDDQGNVYVTGETQSDNFPTANALQQDFGGMLWLDGDAFLAKLNPDGSDLVYSTYLGGDTEDIGHGIAVDNFGNATIVGSTISYDFPIRNALQPAMKDFYREAFVTKVNADGSDYIFSTYWGGSYIDDGYAVAVDHANNIYITGHTSSNDFPTENAYQSQYGSGDAFVTKLNPTGSEVVYSTYLTGGIQITSSNQDVGKAIAVDARGSAFVAGVTASIDFPTTFAQQPNFGGGQDGFVSKFSPDGSFLMFSTYLGGSGYEQKVDIALDDNGNAYVTGQTNSSNFYTNNALQAELNGAIDVFISHYSSDGLTMPFSTYLGGSNWDRGRGIVVDSDYNIYVSGLTNSYDFPTEEAMQPNWSGGSDGFVVKIATVEKGILAVSPNPIIFPLTLPGESAIATVELANVGADSLKIHSIEVEPTIVFTINNKPSLPLGLDSGENVEIQVAYTPLSAATGQKSSFLNSASAGALTVVTDAEQPITSVPIETTGIIINQAGDEPDVNPIDGQCDVDPDEPGNQCTLRAAIQTVNGVKDDNITKVVFSIPGAGTPVIQPSTPLPPIEYPVELDGSTQNSGYVILDGKEAGYTSGLLIWAGRSTVNSMNIRFFESQGVKLAVAGENTIVNCRIESNGVDVKPYEGGIGISDCSENTIIDNVITGNKAHGIIIDGLQATKNVIENNKIGTDVSGMLANGNFAAGVFINDASNNELRNNTISGNGTGVWINSTTYAEDRAVKNILEYNRVGTNADGNQALPNSGSGIYLTKAVETYITGNVISANGGAGEGYNGIDILEHTTGTSVAQNKIGTDASGTLPMPNNGNGILIADAANKNEIVNNVISSNASCGVLIKGIIEHGQQAHSNEILFNKIGTDMTGEVPLGNGTHGIEVNGPGVSKNSIEYNTISANTLNGVFISGNGHEDINWVKNNLIGTNHLATKPLGNGKHGIYFKEAQSTIKNNLISANSDCGIFVENALPFFSTIVENIIGGNFRIKDPNNNMGNRKNGITITDASADVWRNQIRYNNNTGLSLNNMPRGIVNRNTIANSHFGIGVFHSYPPIVNNLIINNHTAVHITNADEKAIILANNKIFDNFGSNTGIHVKNSRVILRGNSISHDVSSAIVVETPSIVSANHNNIFANQGYGINNLEPGIPVNAQTNWWGDASGPGGSGPGSGDAVSDGVDFSNWKTEIVSVVAAAENDTIFMPTGETDTVSIFFQNWANMNDVLDINVSENLGWVQTPVFFSAQLSDSLGAVEQIIFTIPMGIPDGTQNHVQVAATSQSNANDTDTTSCVIISANAAILAISITPDSITVAPGDSVLFRATGFDQFYRSFEFTPEWSSTGGVIDAEGLYIAGNEIGTFQVTATDAVSGISKNAQVVIAPAVSVNMTIGDIPSTFQLYQNYPNPFNSTTIIRFDLPEAGEVNVTIFNILGQRITVLTDRKYTAGQHQLRWQGRDEAGRDAANGIYIYCIESDSRIQSRKLLLLR